MNGWHEGEADGSDYERISEEETQRLIGELLPELSENMADECRRVVREALVYAPPKRNVNADELAERAAEKLGSVRELLNADETLLRELGFSESAAILFKLISELIPIYYAEKSPKTMYIGAQTLAELFRPYFVGKKTERLMLACFDSCRRLISIEIVSDGTITSTRSDTRKIAEIVLRTSAKYAALSHNHPTGTYLPSRSDILQTRKIERILESLDVELLDHIIIGRDGEYSMREDGEFFNKDKTYPIR